MCVSEPKRYLLEDRPEDHYMADPSVHEFDGKLYIYPSHDWDSPVPEDDFGSHFDMKDYHVLSIEGTDPLSSPVKDWGKILDINDVAWARRQLWDCDVAKGPDGKYYLYFPAKDKTDIFRIGVAVSDTPTGKFKALDNPIRGSYSIDVAVFHDDVDDNFYLYFGGIWGGQLQRYRNNLALDEGSTYPLDDEPAIPSRMARLDRSMTQFAEEPKPIVILDKHGNPLCAGDSKRRFFEASWVHKHDGKYYYSYSTGDTHTICYALGDNPYGPFVFGGVLLTEVVGWTTHHSIVTYRGEHYLFHHDCKPSGGNTRLRSLKVCKLSYNKDGSINTINGMC